jgi:hypothetical protein
MNSGDVMTNLNVGNYSVEFKPVNGQLTPTPQSIQLSSGGTYSETATYFSGTVGGAATPSAVPFPGVATNAPYCFNGQLQTSVGFGSGFVVQPRVVLTAAHVLFNDYTLAYASTVNWFFQRYQGQNEPQPLAPRGWYVFDGYAAQRQLDNSPGISSPASQNLDAAAVYFLANAGGGGYGGYLATDADANQYLLNADNKFLAGYPLNGVVTTDQGKLFATTPANLNFTRLYTHVYATTNIQSYPGNSGGPLYVQAVGNQYYPAGIFLGGSGETIVRAIDSSIVDLINRAVVSGNGGGNSTGGGVTIFSVGLSTTAFGTGLLTVNLAPNLNNFHPGWRITGLSNTNFNSDMSSTVSLIGGAGYPLEFKSVSGFIAPSNVTVLVGVNQSVTVQANYAFIQPAMKLSGLTNLTFTGATGATYRVDYTTNLLATPWIPLYTQTLSSSSITVSNLGPATNKARFFRTVLLTQ